MKNAPFGEIMNGVSAKKITVADDESVTVIAAAAGKFCRGMTQCQQFAAACIRAFKVGIAKPKIIHNQL